MLEGKHGRRDAGSAIDAESGEARAPRNPKLRRDRRLSPLVGPAAHVASVCSVPASGGVPSDYLETKRLGQLLDQWREQADLEPSPVRAVAGERRGWNLGTVQVLDNSLCSALTSTARPSRTEGDSASSVLTRLGSSVDFSDGEDTTGITPSRVSEQRSCEKGLVDDVDRVFAVLTNPKLPRQRLMERSAAEGSCVPRHIEALPVLSLR